MKIRLENTLHNDKQEFKANISEDKTKINNVSLITSGVEALGHNVKMTDKTLKTALESLNGKDKILAYVEHEKEDEQRDEFDVPGFFENIRIESGKLLADFKFTNAFIKNSVKTYETILELAETVPEIFGVSIEAFGKKVNGEYLVRKLTGAAFVAHPSANPDGLFSEGLQNRNENKEKENMKLIKEIYDKFSDNTEKLALATKFAAELDEATFEEIETKVEEKFAEDYVKELEDKVKTLETKIKELEDKPAEVDEEKVKEVEDKLKVAEDEKEKMSAKFDALKEKFGVENFDLNDKDDDTQTLAQKFEAITDPTEKQKFYAKHKKDLTTD